MTSRLAASLLSVAACLPAGALNIELNAAPGMDANALAGFQAAAAFWESRLTDSVDVYLNVGFSALDPGVLGQAGSTQLTMDVDDFFAVLAADATSSYDALAVGNLPPLSVLGGLSFLTQTDIENGNMIVSLDDDDSINNTRIILNSANAKALNIYSSTNSDASITFSSGFSWDFDSSDGVGAGLHDFVGVAIHEIGHALGFTSGVDFIEVARTGVVGADPPFDVPFDLDGFEVFTTLDMFRYSAEGVLNLSLGGNPYFSLDGGATNLALFSTGDSPFGDGRQASHWKDLLGIGIMDPTAQPPGTPNIPTVLDEVALDVIGWDVVPEPSSLVMAVFGSLLLVGRRRRR